MTFSKISTCSKHFLCFIFVSLIILQHDTWQCKLIFNFFSKQIPQNWIFPNFVLLSRQGEKKWSEQNLFFSDRFKPTQTQSWRMHSKKMNFSPETQWLNCTAWWKIQGSFVCKNTEFWFSKQNPRCYNNCVSITGALFNVVLALQTFTSCFASWHLLLH